MYKFKKGESLPFIMGLQLLSEEELEQVVQQEDGQVFLRGINSRELKQLRKYGPQKFIFHDGTYYDDKYSLAVRERANYHRTSTVIAHVRTIEDIQEQRFKRDAFHFRCKIGRTEIFFPEWGYYRCHVTFTGKVYVCKLNK